MKGSLDPERQTKAIRVPLDTSRLALPKPSRPEHTQPKDGRRIEKPREYIKTKQAIWLRQNKRCAKCKKFLPTTAWGQRHHINGRGAGRRDDSPEQSELLCFDCHRKIHQRGLGKRRGSK